jgi:hypothetical protein
MTSPDGITWTQRMAAQANTWMSITYGNGLFVTVSQNGTNRVMTSPDGISWTSGAAAQVNTWMSVTYGSSRFVAVSFDGTDRVMTADCAPASACTAPVHDEGTMIYNIANCVMQYCNGTTWAGVGGSELCP